MNKILNKLSLELLSGKDISEILDHPKEYPIKLVEKLSIEVAKLYWNGKMSFEEGDCVMNNLQSFWVTNDYFVKNSGFGKIS